MLPTLVGTDYLLEELEQYVMYCNTVLTCEQGADVRCIVLPWYKHRAKKIVGFDTP